MELKENIFIDRLNKLAFESIIFSLTEHKKGPKWGTQRALKAVKRYKWFLLLVHRYPDKRLVLPTDVDEVWHAHLEDSVKYMSDCQTLFGKYIHHFPYLGTRGEKDLLDWQRLYKETRELFDSEFEDPLLESDGSIALAAYCQNGVSIDSEPRPVPMAISAVQIQSEIAIAA